VKCERKLSVDKCSEVYWVNCSEVLQCSDGLSNKVSNIIRRHIDNTKLLLICILLLLHSLGSIFIMHIYMVVFLYNTVIYVFLLLCQCILVCLCIFIVPAGTLRLPRLRFFCAFFSVVRQMPGYNPQRRGTARTLPKFLCCSIYCLFCVILYIVCV
jgi:hypothetical protein